MNRRTFSDSQLVEAIKTSESIRQAIFKLNLIPAGGNYSTISKLIKKLNIDTSHFTGKLWSKGKQVTLKVPIEKYLTNELPIQSHKLKLRLLREKFFTHKCYKCNSTHWLDKIIPLELEHIDGNPLNNNLVNLTLLCPNCHALTPTYRGKNKKH